MGSLLNVPTDRHICDTRSTDVGLWWQFPASADCFHNRDNHWELNISLVSVMINWSFSWKSWPWLILTMFWCCANDTCKSVNSDYTDKHRDKHGEGSCNIDCDYNRHNYLRDSWQYSLGSDYSYMDSPVTLQFWCLFSSPFVIFLELWCNGHKNGPRHLSMIPQKVSKSTWEQQML